MQIRLAVAALALGAASLGAQARNADPDVAQRQGNAARPAGWDLRLDRANADPSQLRFETMGEGLHVTSGPAETYWNNGSVGQGSYSVEATLVQMKSPTHAEAYGLLWGGRNLNAPNQEYLYFLIRKDGKYLVKHRAGDATHDIQAWAEHPAIKAEGADGKQSNTLRIEVSATSTKLYANGTMIREIPKSGMSANTDGIAGIRVNHNLDVHIGGFKVTRGM